MSERLMRIGELAERTGLSLPTIRHYDDVGLVSPSARTVGNFRLYSDADYERLMVIRRMKPLGFTVEEMRDVLTIVDGLRAPTGAGEERFGLRRALDAYLEDAAARRDKLQRQVERADEFIAILQREVAAMGAHACARARPRNGRPAPQAHAARESAAAAGRQAENVIGD